MQKCTKCLEVKEETEFHANSTRLSGRCTVCKACAKVYSQSKKVLERRRDWSYKKNYGISLAEFNERSEAQGHQCGICKIDAVHVQHGYLVVDHGHDSGEVRKLLCKKCNAALGLFMDNPDFVDSAAAYLRKHGK